MKMIRVVLVAFLFAVECVAQTTHCESAYKDGVLTSSCDSKGYHSSLYCRDGKCDYNTGSTFDSHIETGLPEWDSQRQEALARAALAERKAIQDLCRTTRSLSLDKCVATLPIISRDGSKTYFPASRVDLFPRLGRKAK